jgi:hypothetical protein
VYKRCMGNVYFNEIGWIGGICMALCAIAEVIHCLRKGYTGCSWGLLVLWMLGEVCLCIVELQDIYMPRLVNYIVNILCLTYLIRCKIKRRR